MAGSLRNIDSGKMKRSINRSTSPWQKILASALLATIPVQVMFSYLSNGNLTSLMEVNEIIELAFTYLYFISLFWFYPKISSLIHSDFFSNVRGELIKILEGFTIITSTILLTVLTKLLPLWIILLFVNIVLNNGEASWAFDMEAIRRSLIVHAILGLFLYYFVEREKILKKIRAEHLKNIQLQKEEYRSKLENLKSQVNPQFLFTKLDELENLIPRDTLKAGGYVRKLSFIYRYFLESRDQLVPLHKEIKVVQAYIDILNMEESSPKIRCEITVPDEKLNKNIPPGSLQFILDDIIYKKGQTCLNLKIILEDEKLVCSFSDFSKNKPISFTSEEVEQLQTKYAFFTEERVEFFVEDSNIKILLPLLELDG